jgi:cystathionine gamma-synthase
MIIKLNRIQHTGGTMQIETIAVHGGHEPDPAFGSVAPAIHLSTTFSRDETGELVGPHTYIRSGSPNRTALEQSVAALEGGSRAFCFASGVAAIHAVLQTLDPGDHVLAPVEIYHGTRDLLLEMQRWGLRVSFSDIYNLDVFRTALIPDTRLVFVETPSNPMLRITDIQAVARAADQVGAAVVVDNTWATPVLQRPLELDADFAVHSSTKYFGGHSDVMGGVVVCRQDGEPVQQLAALQSTTGAVPAPFDCWLIRRGLMTLPVRVRAQSQSAGLIAEFLQLHAGVSQVHYPGLASHPGHTIARRQMSDYGGMLSFELAGGEEAARRVLGKLSLFARATSLGGVESLVEHRYRVEGPHSKTPKSLLRISVGLENVEDLIADLENALKR